jgi:hypothetical protein
MPGRILPEPYSLCSLLLSRRLWQAINAAIFGAAYLSGRTNSIRQKH